MKKFVAMLVMGAVLFSSVVGCGSEPAKTPAKDKDKAATPAPAKDKDAPKAP